MPSICQFFCLGCPTNSYRGLDRWNIAHAAYLLLDTPHLSSGALTAVEQYIEHYLDPQMNELRALDLAWRIATEQLIEFYAQYHLRPAGQEPVHYHVVAAVDVRYTAMMEREQRNVIGAQAQTLGPAVNTHALHFLGYDLIEGDNAWSILQRTNEWQGPPFSGNAYQLCATRAEANHWLARYGNSSDQFMGGFEAYRLLALYEYCRF